ncbi:MAG: CBS domain-containing protein [Planctomycetales bacterium]|nr:CBS domain-containing protein [Planctomycetales bacterium]
MNDSDPRPDVDEFQDPLEIYETTYADALEEALAEKTVDQIQHSPYLAVPSTTTVRDAVKALAEHQVACLLVTENSQLVGLFSDRDVLDRVALEYDRLADEPISKVMTANPVYVHDTDSTAAALSVMAISGFRHVPVLDLNGELKGIVSPQRVTEFLTQHFG